MPVASDASTLDGDDGGPEAGAEASLDEGVGDANPDMVVPAPQPVLVGLVPNARSDSDGGGVEGTATAALISAMSAGARGLVLSYTWSELASDGDAAQGAWSELATIAKVARQQGRGLLLDIRTVDSTLDGRPPELAGSSAPAWDSAETVDAIQVLIDRLFQPEMVGTELRYLSLGFEFDRYLDANPSQREPYARFAAKVIDSVSRNVNRPAHMQPGVTWSKDGWRNGLPDWATSLVAASDVMMLSYAAQDDSHHAMSPDAARAELEKLVIEAGKPVVLQQVSYPSSSLIGGSEQMQAQWLQELFGLVATRRASIPWVAVHALHDPSPARCLSQAQAQGLPGSAEVYAYWCSTGLRARDGTPKAGFEAFVAGAATFLEP
jgi:hypothetical protein